MTRSAGARCNFPPVLSTRPPGSAKCSDRRYAVADCSLKALRAAFRAVHAAKTRTTECVMLHCTTYMSEHCFFFLSLLRFICQFWSFVIAGNSETHFRGTGGTCHRCSVAVVPCGCAKRYLAPTGAHGSRTSFHARHRPRDGTPTDIKQARAKCGMGGGRGTARFVLCHFLKLGAMYTKASCMFRRRPVEIVSLDFCFFCRHVLRNAIANFPAPRALPTYHSPLTLQTIQSWNPSIDAGGLLGRKNWHSSSLLISRWRRARKT